MMDHGMHHHHGHGGLTVHGMLIVGEKTVYPSHLPMFTDPKHAIQAILEVNFTAESGNPRSVYANDRQRTGTKVYTFQPKRFVLSGLVSPDPEQPPPCRFFKGNVFQGHFERGGEPILEDVVVEVTNIVHFRELDIHSQGLPQLGYLLFGKGRELFLAHLITKPPDFDQVLSVRVVGHDFTDEQLGQGVLVAFPERANSIPERIRGESG